MEARLARLARLALILSGLRVLAALGVIDGCISWRQTGGCDPDGVREPAADKACDLIIDSGASGYCECANGVRVSRVACIHPPFACKVECRLHSAAPRTSEPTCSADGTCDPPPVGAIPPPPTAASTAATESTPSPPRDQRYSCLGWRQTHGCDPDGLRDEHADRACSDMVPAGASGYCECAGALDGRRRRVRLSGCDHAPFECESECARAAHYDCDGWHQTGNCSSDGPREPELDRDCDAEVSASVSGYCSCHGGARRVARPAGCASDWALIPSDLRCRFVCARGEGLYEVGPCAFPVLNLCVTLSGLPHCMQVLGLPEEGGDGGVSEQAIKQSFRRLSLKLHPDKQRTAEQREFAARRFAEVRAAYDVLAAPDARILYDMHGYQAASEATQKQRGDDGSVEMSVSLAEV